MNNQIDLFFWEEVRESAGALALWLSRDPVPQEQRKKMELDFANMLEHNLMIITDGKPRIKVHDLSKVKLINFDRSCPFTFSLFGGKEMWFPLGTDMEVVSKLSAANINMGSGLKIYFYV